MIKATIILFVISFNSLFCQGQIDSLYHFELSFTASPVISNFKNERYPGAANETKFGYSAYIRGMWHPGRMLSFGIMSGYLLIGDDNITTNSQNNNLGNKAEARLAAIPLQVAVSMQKNGIEIGIGMGPYMLISEIQYGTTAYGRRFELGLTFFGSFVFPINEKFQIGPELKILYLSYRGIFCVMPSIDLRLNLWSY